MPVSTSRRGAPPGNLNNLKHGLYSRRFPRSEVSQLQELSTPGLQGEIDMLRLVICRVVDHFKRVDDDELMLRYLSVLSQATAQLSRMMRIQHLILPYRGEAETALQQALEELTIELGLDGTQPLDEEGN